MSHFSLPGFADHDDSGSGTFRHYHLYLVGFAGLFGPTYDIRFPLARSIGWSSGSTRNTSRQPGKPFSLSSPMLTIPIGERAATRSRRPLRCTAHNSATEIVRVGSD